VKILSKKWSPDKKEGLESRGDLVATSGSGFCMTRMTVPEQLNTALGQCLYHRHHGCYGSPGGKGSSEVLPFHSCQSSRKKKQSKSL
jgi:hypothetical protein